MMAGKASSHRHPDRAFVERASKGAKERHDVVVAQASGVVAVMLVVDKCGCVRARVQRIEPAGLRPNPQSALSIFP